MLVRLLSRMNLCWAQEAQPTVDVAQGTFAAFHLSPPPSFPSASTKNPAEAGLFSSGQSSVRSLRLRSALQLTLSSLILLLGRFGGLLDAVSPARNLAGAQMPLSMINSVAQVPTYVGTICHFLRGKHGCRLSLNL
jgi:hypothetical protein